jgi:ABC-type branched-subunit amino acid transport system ATPase component
VLEIRNLDLHFGALHVTRDINLTLPRGARHALIGPNGAGKTTLVNLLTGQLKPDSGKILLDDQEITRLPPHQRARRGLGRTYQINALFRSMTPVEAVSLAIAQRDGNALRVFGTAALGRRTGEEARELLQAVGLGQYMNHMTRELPYGVQRLLEVALALAGKPKVLLLDEPAAGVSTQAGDQLFRLIDSLPSDLAILLIEHDMRLVFRFAKRITVLVGGGVLVEGTPEEIGADQRVRDVYLGHKHAA